jgi:sugar phosphate isomerase/epimerase
LTVFETRHSNNNNDAMSNKLTRRNFAKLSVTGAAGLIALNGLNGSAPQSAGCVRLGGPIFGDIKDPDGWIKALKAEGYSAAYCPVEPGADLQTIRAYEKAAKDADIVISEVGAWSNPISKSEKERKESIKKCKEALALADQIGAGCCVNITGSRSAKWDGPDPDNITKETFDMIVQVTREIIDEVKPVRTFYTLETMPWALPDSPDTYLQLIKAIGRKQLAAHLDPVNMINSPRRYYDTGAFIKECFAKLGPYIKNCHAKDISLSTNLTVHLDEVIPGTGNLNYSVYLIELSKLKNIPMMLEHLKTKEEYKQAATYVRSVAKSSGISLC